MKRERHNKELKLTKPSIMELRSLTLCSTDVFGIAAMLRRVIVA
jgi:hypothetical protein